MFKMAFKLGIWVVVGVVSTITLLNTTNFQTPWKYVFTSTITPGTQFTVTPPNGGELMTVSVTEGQTLSGTKSFDVGAPLTVAAMYALGSGMAYGLKKRRARDTT